MAHFISFLRAQAARRHAGAIASGALVGIIFISHHILIPLFFFDDAHARYFPVTRDSFYDEAILYVPRAQAAFLDFRAHGDISVAGQDQSPSLLPMLNPLILGGLGKILGSLERAFVASDFLFPVLIFFLLYALALACAGRPIPALLFAVFFIFFPKLGMAFPPLSAASFEEIRAVFVPFAHAAEPLHFLGFEEPKVTFLFLAGAWLLIWRALQSASAYASLAAGVSFGLLFYTYFYDWTAVFVALFFLLVFFLLSKQYRRAKCVLIIAGVGFLVSSAYWWNLFVFYQMPHAADIMARVGTEISREFRFASVWKSYVRAGTLMSLLVLWIRLKKEYQWSPAHMLIAFLGTYAVLVNAQVITGINPEPDHWYRTQFLPVSLSIFLLSLWAYDRIVRGRGRAYAKLGAFLLLLFLFVSVGVSRYVYAKEHAAAFSIPQRVFESYAWLNAHTSRESVVGAFVPLAESHNDFLIHTHNKVFLPYGVATAVSNEELWDRFAILADLFQFDSREFAKVAQDFVVPYVFVGTYFDRSFDSAFSPARKAIPEGLLEEKVRAYEARRLSDGPFSSPYRLDYIYIDAKNMPWGGDPGSVFSSLKKIYDREGIVIYNAALGLLNIE